MWFRLAWMFLGASLGCGMASALAWAFATSTKPIGLMYSFGLISPSESLAGSLPDVVTLMLGRVLAWLGSLFLLASALAWVMTRRGAV